MYALKPSSDNKYFYIKTQKKFFNMFNKKILTKIPNLHN